MCGRTIQKMGRCNPMASGTENNAYAVLDILPGDAIRITGFRKQESYGWR